MRFTIPLSILVDPKSLKDLMLKNVNTVGKLEGTLKFTMSEKWRTSKKARSCGRKLWLREIVRKSFSASNATTCYTRENFQISDTRLVLKETWRAVCGESRKHGSEGGLRETSQEDHGAYPMSRQINCTWRQRSNCVITHTEFMHNLSM